MLGSACLGEFVVGLLLEELAGGESVAWPEQGSFDGNMNPAGIRRNPKESGVIW